jgi:hypothetical protein
MFGLELELYQWIAIGGGGMAVIALLLHFVLPKGFKVPTVVLGVIAGLIGGLGVGVVGMASFGYRTAPDPAEVLPGPPLAMVKGMGLPGKGAGLPGKGMPGMGGKGKGPAGPSPKTELATLVVKIHLLTDKPLTLSLSEQQRSTIAEQLRELADKEDLSDDDAKARLEAILDSVKAERAILEAAGFRWPAQGGAGGIPTPPAAANPFKGGENRERLLALQTSLAKKN